MAYLGHFCLVSKNKSLTFYSKNAIILEPSDGKSGGFNLEKNECNEYIFLKPCVIGGQRFMRMLNLNTASLFDLTSRT